MLLSRGGAGRQEIVLLLHAVDFCKLSFLPSENDPEIALSFSPMWFQLWVAWRLTAIEALLGILELGLCLVGGWVGYYVIRMLKVIIFRTRKYEKLQGGGGDPAYFLFGLLIYAFGSDFLPSCWRWITGTNSNLSVPRSGSSRRGQGSGSRGVLRSSGHAFGYQYPALNVQVSLVGSILLSNLNLLV